MIGSHAAMVPFETYVPRDEPPSFTSGGHRVLVDRVEWKMIPDAATAANAMVTGEVDWLEMPLPDLLPMLQRAPERGDRAAGRLGFHQPVAAEPRDRRRPTT